jgi:hypothetical protein
MMRGTGLRRVQVGEIVYKTLSLLCPGLLFRTLSCSSDGRSFPRSKATTTWPPPLLLTTSSARISLSYHLQQPPRSRHRSLLLSRPLLSQCAALTLGYHFPPARSDRLRTMKDCPECRGNGTVKCEICNGKGDNCRSCKRTGKNKCNVCEGTGVIQSEH